MRTAPDIAVGTDVGSDGLHIGRDPRQVSQDELRARGDLSVNAVGHAALFAALTAAEAPSTRWRAGLDLIPVSFFRKNAVKYPAV
jgi:hypothetical protein